MKILAKKLRSWKFSSQFSMWMLIYFVRIIFVHIDVNPYKQLCAFVLMLSHMWIYRHTVHKHVHVYIYNYTIFFHICRHKYSNAPKHFMYAVFTSSMNSEHTQGDRFVDWFYAVINLSCGIQKDFSFCLSVKISHGKETDFLIGFFFYF